MSENGLADPTQECQNFSVTKMPSEFSDIIGLELISGHFGI